MYEMTYHLSDDPFRMSPDKRFCFGHESYNKAKSYLKYALHRADGFVMITGGPGTGKTTLLTDLLTDIDAKHVAVAHVVTTQLDANNLLKLVAFEFGLAVEGLDKAGILVHLERFLTQQFHTQRRALLIVDEAQDLEPSALEEMRLLTNLQVNNQPLLQVFLVGQEGLHDILLLPELEQLHQRLIASSHLRPMSADETATYVLHRLATANWHQDPHISMGALRRIHIFSRGIPRRVNQICSRLLLYGVVEDRHTLDSHDVQAVIMELRHEHLAPASDIDPPEGMLDEDDEFVADFSENHLHYLRMDAVLHDKKEVRPTDETGKISHIEAYKAATPKKPVNVFPDVDSQSPTSIDEHQEPFIDKLSSVVSSDDPDSDALSPNWGDSEIPPEVASDTPSKLGDVEGLDEILSDSVSDGTEQRFFAIVGVVLVVVLVFVLFIQWEDISANLPGQVVQIKQPLNEVAMVHGDSKAPVPQSQSRLSELDRLQAELSSTMETGITRLGQGPTSRLVMTFPPSMSFALGRETIKPVLDSRLRELAGILAKHKAITIRITGHSDLSGSMARNEYLSGRRAQVVMARLAALGIDRQRLKAIGRGSRELKSTTDSRKNRRVEITLGQS